MYLSQLDKKLYFEFPKNKIVLSYTYRNSIYQSHTHTNLRKESKSVFTHLLVSNTLEKNKKKNLCRNSFTVKVFTFI